MGAESSILDDCDLDEAVEDESCPWVLRNGQLADDTLITIFSDQNCDGPKRKLFQRNVKNLKSLRHPSILRFLASGERSSHTYVVAERVVPLLKILESLSSIEICAGLFSLLEGLSFLHEKAGMCHNNICLESVYVTETGHWKLGSLEHTCKFADSTPDFLRHSRTHRGLKVISPEEKEEKMKNSPDLAFARDVYSFAVMVEELLERLEDLGDMTKTFELRIQDECLNPDPKARPKLETLLNDRLFRNDFITISRFLQDITLKSEEEKKEFFEDVMEQLYKIPEETVGKCLVRSLLCRFVLLDNAAKRYLIPHILVPCRDNKRPSSLKPGEITPLFSQSTYRTFVVPEIYRVFHCHDYHIRMVLLSHFSHYVRLFDKEDLEETILPQLLLGLRDINEDLVALSLHCLADLVPLLGRQMVVGGKAKTYFKQGQPKMVKGTMEQPNGGGSLCNSVKSVIDKPEVFTSVNSVMGKPRLKDLAKLSKAYTASERENETQRKTKEKEERMLEAKLKREKKRLEKQTKSEKIALSESDEVVSHDSRAVTESSDTDQLIHTTEQNLDQTSNTDSDSSIDEDVYVTEDKGHEDWSDWEDKPGDLHLEEGQVKGHASDLSREYTPEPRVHSDHTVNTPQSPVTDVFNCNSDWTTTSSVKDSNSYSPKQGLTNKSSKNSKSSNPLLLKSKKKPKQSSNTTTLGAEFDIMEIEVKKIKAEKEVVDFFADMVPEIKTVEAEIKTVEPMLAVEGGTETTHKAPTISMVYTAPDNDQDGDRGGWGDDVDWDDNGF